MNKTLFFLACVIVGANALTRALMDEMIHLIEEKGAECAATEKASDADVEALIKKEIPSSHEGKCIIYCVFKKLNIMLSDGSFGPGYEVWLEKAKADDADFYTNLMKLYRSCESKAGGEVDPCEKAAKLTECVKGEGAKIGFEIFT